MVTFLVFSTQLQGMEKMILPTNELKTVVTTWIKAYENRNLDTMKSLFAASPETFHYGTGTDEMMYGFEGMMQQLSRDWSQSEGAQLKLHGFRAQQVAPTVAWIACELEPVIIISGQKAALPLLRATMVVVKENSGWKIAHSHASWPYSEQAVGQSFPEVKS